MKNEKELLKLLESINKKEIKNLRKSYKKNNKIDKYLNEVSKKIFKNLIFPYFRFEILLRSVEDVIKNKEYYSNMDEQNIKKVRLILKQLQGICFYLNRALHKLNKMTSYIDKH